MEELDWGVRCCVLCLLVWVLCILGLGKERERKGRWIEIAYIEEHFERSE